MNAEQIQQLLTALLQGNAASSISQANLASSIDSRISKFVYDPENGQTFEQWHKRFCILFEEDGKDLTEQAKVRLLLGKLGDDEYTKYRDTISPEQPDKATWAESTNRLKELFAETRSLFVRRYECFRIRQQPNQDISSLVAQINASCEHANLSLTKEQLKCMILVISLRDEHHDLRQKCLKMMKEAEKSGTTVTLKKLEEELKAIQIVKDSALSLLSTPASTNAIRTRPQQWRESKPKAKSANAVQQNHSAQQKKATGGKAIRGQPTQPCGSCGGTDHWRSDCRFREATCHKCQKQGHFA